MIDDIHIDDFCRDSALILLYLYHHFPRKTELYVEDIIGPDEQDEYGLHSARHLSCLATMVWLAEEGLIRYGDTIRQEALDQVVLTQATFLSLAKPYDPLASNRHASKPAASELPDSVQQKYPSHIAEISQSLKSGSSSSLRTTMMDLLHRLNHP